MRRPLSFKELSRYFDAKKLDAKCHRCGENSWLMASETGHDHATTIMMFDLNNPDFTRNTFIYTITLSCGNCGTIWQLRRQQIEDWFADNPSSGAYADE
jgi:uncharacterized Zn finger protein